MDALWVLGIAAGLWFSLHAVVAGSGLRWWLVSRIGERAFRAVFAVLSIAALWFLIAAYRAAPCAPIWIPPRELLYAPILLMPLAFLLLAGAFTVPNPTAVGREAALDRAEPARGVLRITRHPFLWAVALWSGVHALVNGNVASLLFFGSMLATALVGMRDIDRKRRRTDPLAYSRYEQSTSNVPFHAVATGRNQLVLRELLVPSIIAVALTAVLVVFHDQLFHVRPIP